MTCKDCNNKLGPITYISPIHKKHVCEDCIMTYEYDTSIHMWTRKEKTIKLGY